MKSGGFYFSFRKSHGRLLEEDDRGGISCVKWRILKVSMCVPEEDEKREGRGQNCSAADLMSFLGPIFFVSSCSL